MNVSYRQLQAFVQVAQSSTFAEAAQKMCLSQPALSSAIKKMEEQVGGALFSRTTRKVQLSPEGQDFLPTAIRLMNDWQDAFGDLQQVFSMGRGKLSIAAMPSFAVGHLPSILSQFQSQFPNVKVSVADIVMEQVIKAVLEERVAMGFTFETEQLEGLTFHPMFSDKFIAVLPSKHALSANSEVSWGQLAQYPFVAMNRGSAIRRWVDSHYEHLALKLNMVAEASQLATLGQFVEHELGVSIVPGLCQQQMQRLGLVCLPIKGPGLSKRVGMVKKVQSNMSVSAQALWDWVNQQSPLP
ncbi:LysR family transcriptional regulator [Paraglaciecola chathamensis]|uniref:LysR family transcriptional regulator n=1 Tax=Paraglaciecola chathamensis TaxID=368405 RepID=UPI0027098EC6|nr:LysR family transcriptional regulator [Paraglaciecola chathamensis]MDO6838400.1 LysR family transcriptional regulator [Paraglaciecola chathamensis]